MCTFLKIVRKNYYLFFFETRLISSGKMRLSKTPTTLAKPMPAIEKRPAVIPAPPMPTVKMSATII